MTTSLSRREVQVLAGIARGWTDGKIALALSIDEETVGEYVRRVFEKLGACSRANAVHEAWIAGICLDVPITPTNV